MCKFSDGEYDAKKHFLETIEDIPLTALSAPKSMPSNSKISSISMTTCKDDKKMLWFAVCAGWFASVPVRQ